MDLELATRLGMGVLFFTAFVLFGTRVAMELKVYRHRKDVQPRSMSNSPLVALGRLVQVLGFAGLLFVSVISQVKLYRNDYPVDGMTALTVLAISAINAGLVLLVVGQISQSRK